MRLLTASLSAVLLAVPCAGQLTVSVQATNDAGIAIDRANNTRSLRNHAPNTPITTFSAASIYDQNPYAYLMSYVYPPFVNPNGPTYNRVMLAASVYTQKNSGHASLHTTDNRKGDPGTQKFRITLSSVKAIPVKIDWSTFGYIYAASTASLKFTIGTTTKTWNWTNGYQSDTGSLQVNVSGSVNLDVEITGLCKPGGTGGSPYYDGFYAYLNLNIVEAGTGSFATFGTGCAQGKIGAATVPTRGSPFTLTLTGDKPNASCALLWGYSKDYYQFIKLPLDLSYMGANGCFLNVGFNYPWYQKTDAQGDVSAQVYIPYWASGTLYAQWLIWDPTSPSTAPTLTQGAEIKY